MSEMDQPLTPGTRHARLPWLLFFGSSVILAAVLIVQRGVLYGVMEVTVRLTASALGLFAVPIFLALAFRDWRARRRAGLSLWRSGFGLSSILVLSAAWLIYWSTALLAWSGALKGVGASGLEWMSLVLGCCLLGLPLAIALRGNSRPQTISAALLMYASVQSSIYF